MKREHNEGDPCMIEVWNPKKKECDLLPGQITKIVSAIDRDYRINVKLSDGREFKECAPECIKVSPQQSATSPTTTREQRRQIRLDKAVRRYGNLLKKSQNRARYY